MDFIGVPVAILAALEAAGELPVRLKFAPWCNPGVTDAELEGIHNLQQHHGRRWAVDGVKMFIDGTIDNGTAWLSTPDSLGESHASYWPNPAAYTQAMHWFDDHGIKTVTHAIGDAGLDHVLDSIASSGQTQQHRIEHIESASPSIVARFAPLGVAASLQPTHCTHFTHADESDNWSRRMGPARVSGGWPSRDLRDSGAIVALGSDWPIAHFDPRGIMGAAQLRRDVGAFSDAPRQPSQALTARMALEGYTSHAAAAAGETGLAGIIDVGARADFTVFDTDPLTAAPDALPSVAIVATVIGGQVQYRGAMYGAARRARAL
jgi:predicted amidohydrolase YtcJ